MTKRRPPFPAPYAGLCAGTGCRSDFAKGEVIVEVAKYWYCLAHDPQVAKGATDV